MIDKELSLQDAIYLINQELLDYAEDEDTAELSKVLAPHVLLRGYYRLRKACWDLLEADERGQGVGYSEAMKVIAKETGWVPK